MGAQLDRESIDAQSATVARDRDYRIRAIEVFLYHADHWNPDAHRGEVKIIQGGFTEPSSAEED